MKSINLTINGKKISKEVEDYTLLSTFIYTILYYISFDSEKIYKMNFKESAALVIVSLVTIYMTQILI